MTKKCTVTCLLMLIVLSSANPTNAFYDYQTGRWLNQDPIGYQDSINLYAYVGSNPINRTDPRGLYPGEEDDLSQLELHNRRSTYCEDDCPKEEGIFSWIKQQIDNIFTTVEDCHALHVDIAAIFILNDKNLPGGVTNDKFAHCYTSCRLQQECGTVIMGLGGVTKELMDKFFQGDSTGESNSDMIANADGMNCAQERPDGPGDDAQRDVCERCCSKEYGDPGSMYLF